MDLIKSLDPWLRQPLFLSTSSPERAQSCQVAKLIRSPRRIRTETN